MNTALKKARKKPEMWDIAARFCYTAQTWSVPKTVPGKSNQMLFFISGNILDDKQLLDAGDLLDLSDRRSI